MLPVNGLVSDDYYLQHVSREITRDWDGARNSEAQGAKGGSAHQNSGKSHVEKPFW